MDTEMGKLAPPAVASLRAQTAGAMERSLSQDIREEREELREAAEQTLNVIVDLNLDGTIRWVSPSWVDVIGTKAEDVAGTAIADVVISEPTSIFSDVVAAMQKDDSRSQFIRFSVKLGLLSQLLPLDFQEDPADPDSQVVDLEAQGIMVYDGAKDGESHIMWMIKPWAAPREIKIDLDTELVDSLGSGAEILAGYLTQLADTDSEDGSTQTPPSPVLCRICERQIPPWWFEKHTDLCLQEHQAEMEVQMAQEGLTDHRHAIVKVLDALETRKSRSFTGENTTLPVAEYKGMPIGPPHSTSSSPGTSSPGPTASPSSSASGRSRERPGGFGHARARSFAVRRPQARIVELLLDLCDTALEISPPAIKEASSLTPGEFRTQSPQSESRISQVMQWQSPSHNTLEQEQGLAVLCADTEKAAKNKVDAVFRHRKIIEYAERIRIEFAIKVQDTIEDAMQRAAHIAASKMDESQEDEDIMTSTSFEANATTSLGEDPASLAKALQSISLSDTTSRRFSRTVASTRSSSPKDCPTPKSSYGGLGIGPRIPSARNSRRQSRRESLAHAGSDTGDSDGSMQSASTASRAPRNESPASELGDLRRQASSRSQRRSWILPGTVSPRRQESPSRINQQPSSPLRTLKPRSIPIPHDALASPEASPLLPGGDFSSPSMLYSHSYQHHHQSHHRRQSSAAISLSTGESLRLPPSPRLGAAATIPMARAVPPSIKDFEVIKPISKGAFGSVYLSKKKSTGEYFAIKVLKKADMVAKNQVTNVKAERAIMMWQGESDFVAKLYWTFSSKDYLYLVMEYLNGGDCASLIKVLGGLPEDWVKKYLGEVVLGVEHLHSRGVVHRDLKPDNLLIDQHGHLKLTDFGLSRMGLIGRQKRALNSGTGETAPDLLKTGPFASARSMSIASSRSASLDLHAVNAASPGATPQMAPNDATGNTLLPPSYFSLTGTATSDPRRASHSRRSDSGGSEGLAQMMANFGIGDSQQSSSSQAIISPSAEGSESGSPSLDIGAPLQPSSTASTQMSMDGIKNTVSQGTMPPPNWALFDPEDSNRRFVGTPDYLAPETIRGEPQDESSDWWSVGAIMYEFLYGLPPFNADSAEHVFENILARKIEWPDESIDDVSAEAKDLINKLMCMDASQRLGSNKDEGYASGGEEIRSHLWFAGTNWETLLQDEAQFVPAPENLEDTEYFDTRGATLQSFAEEMEDQLTSPPAATPNDYPDRPHDALSRVRTQVNSMKRGLMPLHIPPHVRELKSRRLSEPVVADDFGAFSYKNLPVLDKANKDVIQKLRAEALATSNKPSPSSPGGMIQAVSPGLGLSLDGSGAMGIPIQKTLSNTQASQRTQSPSGLHHSNSSPNRMSQPSSPLLVSFTAGPGFEGRRKASSNASTLSHTSAAGNAFEVPRVPPSLQKAATTAGNTSSPIKGRTGTVPPSPRPATSTPRHGSMGSSASRSRSLTVGSQEGSPIATDLLANHRRSRRSQVFDMSPSSSDNEGDKANAALLRVQRKRQSSKRMSQINFDGPLFRPLDVLICEDHPVSRMVMEKLLEKLRCRTISASTGSEAVRYSMSDIKFDIIFMEFKLPQINGADVAKMIRETKNTNSHTPVVAITAYLKELSAPHYFDSLIEKPISSSKLTEVLSNLCQWRPMDSPGMSAPISIPTIRAVPGPGLRTSSLKYEDSPISGESTSFAQRAGSSFPGSSREDSISSSLFGDSESVFTDDVPVAISRKLTNDWDERTGLGIGLPSDEPGVVTLNEPGDVQKPPLITEQSAPGKLESQKVTGPLPVPIPRRSFEKLRAKRELMEKRRLEGYVDSADDEDEELGRSSGGKDSDAPATASQAGVPTSASAAQSPQYRPKSILPSSKLGIEMMRANSHDSINLTGSEGGTSTAAPGTQVLTTPNKELDMRFPVPALEPALDLSVSRDESHEEAIVALEEAVEDDEGDMTVIIHTPPRPSAPGFEGDGSPFAAGVEETPRPSAAQRHNQQRRDEDMQPTPRPPGKRDGMIGNFI